MKRYSLYIIYILVLGRSVSVLPAQSYWDSQTVTNEIDWNIDTHTFDKAGCSFIPENVHMRDWFLELTLDKEQNTGTLKKYAGSSIHSEQTYGYGRYTVRMKNNIKSGTVSSFFIMNPWTADNWIQQEIDIEFLGSDTSKVQFTVHFYKNGSDIIHEYVYDLGFDSDKEFHNYGISWTRERVDWLIDGIIVHTETRNLPESTQMNIFMNHWLGNQENTEVMSWLGNISDADLPSSVYYLWVMYEPEIQKVIHRDSPKENSAEQEKKAETSS